MLLEKVHPLVGQNNHHVIITSEMSGFCNYVENYFIVKENDLIECFLNETQLGYHDPISEVKKLIMDLRN